MMRKALTLLYLTSHLAGLLAFAEPPQINPNPLKAQAYVTPKKIPQGANADLIINLDLAPGHHAYLEQFKLVPENPEHLQISAFKIEPISKFFDYVTKKEKDGVKDQAQMRAVVEVTEKLKEGAHTITLNLTYQACTKKYCLLPKTIPIPLSLVVLSSQDPLSLGTTQNSLNTLSIVNAKDWVYQLLLIFLAGLLTSFTPCIFPMIPITLAVLGANSRGQSKTRGFLLSCIYVLGIALTYSSLGLVAASSGVLFGAFLGHPIVAGVIASVFFILALSLFGLFEIRPPAFLANSMARQKVQANFRGVFITGLLAGLVASPCVGPVLIGVLTHVAQTQNLGLGFSLLFIFAVGMGLPFILLGTFSHLINRIPKAGPWMENTKIIFGSAMLALALYYLAPVVSERIFNGLSAMALIGVSSAFGAFTANANLTSVGQRLRKGLMLFAFIVGIFLGIKALFPEVFSGSKLLQSETQKVKWEAFSQAQLDQARKAKQPVIIDFYADWCVACKELEKFTFNHPEVRAIGQNFLWLKYDATTPTPEFTEIREKYRIYGLPHIAFHNANGEFVHELTLTGFEDTPNFIERLKKVLATNDEQPQ